MSPEDPTLELASGSLEAGSIAEIEDIETRKRAERELRASEARYRTLVENAPEAIVVFDVDRGCFVDLNRNAEKLFGRSREELLRLGPADVSPPRQPDGQSSEEAAREWLRATLQGANPRIQWTHVGAGGEAIPCEVRLVRLPSTEGNLVRGSVIDLRDSRRAEALRRATLEIAQAAITSESLEQLLAAIHSVVETLMPAANFFVALWDEASELVSFPYFADQHDPAPEPRRLKRGLTEYVLRTQKPLHATREVAAELKERGEVEQLGTRPVDWIGVPLQIEDRTIGVLVCQSYSRTYGEREMEILRFVSTQVSMVVERRRAEARLRQSQKMEAVGRLAGGVAHDFNNLLTVIQGRGRFLLESLESDPAADDVREILQVADRASELTQQLLAFSREQVLQPEDVHLDDLVRDMERMLQRLIGEDVEVVTELHAGPGRVKADPGQLQQVLLNLAVNARDAMPEGGRFTLATRRLEGDPPRACLTVSDTGTGMDPATVSRAFEPFFTTKAPGAGTGLGLAMVYGIVEQSGGDIRVDSQPGQGTTFEILLPLAEEPDDEAEEGADSEGELVEPGQETILLVEDEDTVRAVAKAGLEIFGYRVIAACGAEEAVKLWGDWGPASDAPSDAGSDVGPDAESKRPSLLVTDVVMPGQSGPALARRLRRDEPDLRVLYMSGYSGTEIEPEELERPGVAYLAKPFLPGDLAAAVRELLDRKV